MLQDIVAHLRCPVCGQPLGDTGRALRCAAGHSFDVARHGYVNLVPGGAPAHEADTRAMVAARERFLAAGHYAALTAALVEACALAPREGPVLDVGAGTGQHLAAILDAQPGRAGIALDRSKHAARRAAKAHARIGAVVADAWGRLPVADASVAAALHVFAPRNGPEVARVLRPDGVAVVATPTPTHLAPLIRALGLLTVDARKRERLEERLGPHLARGDRRAVRFAMRLGHADVLDLVAAGPSSRHVDPGELAARVAALPDPVDTPGEVELSLWRPRRKRSSMRPGRMQV